MFTRLSRSALGVVCAVLAGTAHAAPALFGLHLHPPGSRVRPVGVSLTLPSEVAGVAARFDVVSAIGNPHLMPSVGVALQFSPVHVVPVESVVVRPYAGLGVGTMTYLNEGAFATWTGVAGLRVEPVGQPFGFTLEGRASRGGFGISLGTFVSLEERK